MGARNDGHFEIRFSSFSDDELGTEGYFLRFIRYVQQCRHMLSI
jgi:hypothetical protein